MTTRPTDFLEYLASQEQNMLVSMQKFRQEFDFFSTVDELYQRVLTRLIAPDNGLTRNDVVLPQLFIFSHNHFYLAMSLLLRTHTSDGYHCVRTAIDAALIAYRIILKDGSQEDYLNRVNGFTVVPRHIRQKRKEDPTAYPLAEPLLNLHDYCSQFASHADFSVFLHRLSIDEDEKHQQIEISYFQQVFPTALHQMVFMTFLDAHLTMLGIYEPFLLEKGLIDQKWVSDRNALGLAVISAKGILKNALAAGNFEGNGVKEA